MKSKGKSVKRNILTKSVFVALLLASTVVAAEGNYPATDFQPSIVYSDAPSDDKAAAVEKSTASEVAPAAKAESSNTMLYGVIALVVVGGFFLSGKSKTGEKKAETYSGYGGYSGGLTGVEKYLQTQNSSTAATGVEKYLAKKEAADREVSATGVDRYLRNRG